ncbi:unnamed protein product [Ectocarpus sp. 13 AM-2016]
MGGHQANSPSRTTHCEVVHGEGVDGLKGNIRFLQQEQALHACLDDSLISSYRRIRRMLDHRLMTIRSDDEGFCHCGQTKNKEGKPYRVQRLVAEAFMGHTHI